MGLLYRIVAVIGFIIFIDVNLLAVPCPNTPPISISTPGACTIPITTGFSGDVSVESTGVILVLQSPTAPLGAGVTITSIENDTILELKNANISLNAAVGSSSNPFYLWFNPLGTSTATLTNTIHANSFCMGATSFTGSPPVCSSNAGSTSSLTMTSGALLVQNDIVMGSNAIINVNGGQLSASSIQGISSGVGTLNINASNTLPPIGATNPIKLLQVASDSTATLSGNISMSNTGGADALNVGSGSTLVVGSGYSVNASQITNNGTIKISAAPDGSAIGTLNVTGVISPLSTGNYVIVPSSTIRQNLTFNNFITVNGGWDTGGISGINSLFSSSQSNLNIEIQDADGGGLTHFNLIITMLNDWLAALEANNLSINQKDVINALSAVASSDVAVYDALADSVTLGNIAPFVDSIAGMALPTSIVATQVPNMTANVISDRLTLVQSSLTGVSSGDSNNNIIKGGWVQPFASHAHQGAKDLISGYKSNTGGLAVGFDTIVKDITLGAALSYADTHMRGSGFGSPKYHIETVQGTLYSSYNISNWYLDALGYYGLNHYKSHSNLQEIGIRSGKYHGYQFGGKLGLAYKIYKNEFEITPKATVNYGHIHTNTYTETGAGSLNRMMAKSNYNSSTADAMVNLAKPMKTKVGGIFVPSVNFGAGYDIKSNNIVNTATFVGASTIPYQLYGIKPARASVKGGVNLAYKFDDAMKLAADYICEKRKKYINHSAYLNFSMAF